MKIKVMHYALLLFSGLLFGAAACSDDNTGNNGADDSTLKSILLDPGSFTLAVGETRQLTAAAVPQAATLGDVTWDSRNTAIVTVDENGLAKAVGKGEAVIVASCGDAMGTATVKVNSESREFTLFQLNLWEGLGKYTNGRQALIDHLAALKPDAASFCEFPSTSSAESILSAAAAALKEATGETYYYNYRGGSGTRGILTRHQIVEEPAAVNGNAWFYRTVIDFHGQQIALYASHSNYTYYACYLPRGYGDGESPYTWEPIEAPITDVNYILEREALSGRPQIAVDLINDGKIQANAGRICIFGSDLNQPSHLDWTDAAKNRFEHNGCVVPWQISTQLYADEFRDAYREIYPDPVTHPGITWPVYLEGKTTTWAPLSDDRDRIDYVYFRKNDKLTVTKAQLVGPASTVAFGAQSADSFVDKSTEIIETVNGTWPSDHRGLLVTFNVEFR